MVLSNKKLKQQLRAKFAEISVSKDPDSNNPKKPETPESLKQLLNSATQKPNLSKREKRRENFTSLRNSGENKDTHVEGNSRGKKRRREKMGVEDAGKLEVEVGENGGQIQKVKKKEKKKEKKSGGDVKLGVKESSDLKKKEKEAVKKKNKKKKKKKAKIEKQFEVENGGVSDQIVAETRYC